MKQMSMESDCWLNPKEAAKLFHVSLRTLYDWRERAGFPVPRKVGAIVRWRKSELENWFDAQAEKGGAE